MTAEGKPLNQQIAELLGWKVETRDEYCTDGTPCPIYQLHAPDGEGVGHEQRSEEKAWWFAPDFERSLDEVWRAYISVFEAETGSSIQIMQYNGEYSCWLWYDGKARGATPQEAAAKALLAYLTWKADQVREGEEWSLWQTHPAIYTSSVQSPSKGFNRRIHGSGMRTQA